ncbi:hypothetical protein KDH_10500 [Dictyobacter sp. S3.2.2.5]|uniref:Uncharacterized protein n=1 Tax=Dictyobacter halimunensis TaxID=3026934 RepID=A0ABQ6FP65_9CHLR|nr:hypothetical protein KDH_10500 [Dictyobacter sp. S3.2.2.5]
MNEQMYYFASPTPKGRPIPPRPKDLILTHIFLIKLEKPIARDGLVKQSTVARNPDGRFTDSICKCG